MRLRGFAVLSAFRCFRGVCASRNLPLMALGIVGDESPMVNPKPVAFLGDADFRRMNEISSSARECLGCSYGFTWLVTVEMLLEVTYRQLISHQSSDEFALVSVTF